MEVEKLGSPDQLASGVIGFCNLLTLEPSYLL